MTRPSRFRHARVLALIATLLPVGVRSVLAQTTPPVVWPSTWNTIGACAETEPAGDKTPASSDLVGGVGKSAAYFQSDANYLYLRERVSKTPSGAGGFDQYAWVVLVQTVGADPYKYQWILSLNGVDETVNLWRNDQATAADI